MRGFKFSSKLYWLSPENEKQLEVYWWPLYFNLPVDFQSLDWSWLQMEEEEQNSLEQAS